MKILRLTKEAHNFTFPTPPFAPYSDAPLNPVCDGGVPFRPVRRVC